MAPLCVFFRLRLDGFGRSADLPHKRECRVHAAEEQCEENIFYAVAWMLYEKCSVAFAYLLSLDSDIL